MDMSLFLLILLSGLLTRTSSFQRKYFYINESMTWSSAQSYCRERFTDLATADSIHDVNRMMNSVNDGYNGSLWIGLKRGTQHRWGWSLGDDTLSQYSAWAFGHPGGVAQCAYFASGYWYDDCSTTLHFACYKESVGILVIPQWKTWRDAQTYCRQHYTDLAAIRSLEEQKQLHALVGNGWIWIGLFGDAWIWSDQWSLFYRNWADGYPMLSNDCGAMSMTDSGKWVQHSCDQQNRFICYEVYKKQIIRLNLSCDGNCDLNDPSLQTAVLTQIQKKLQSVGLGHYISLNLRKTEG